MKQNISMVIASNAIILTPNIVKVLFQKLKQGKTHRDYNEVLNKYVVL